MIDLTENRVVWQAPTYEECQQWIDREICEYCCNWANDTAPTKDGQACPSCRGEVSDVGDEDDK